MCHVVWVDCTKLLAHCFSVACVFLCFCVSVACFFIFFKRHQFTALHHAMNELRHDHDAEHEAVVRLLIQAGANMHLKASNGKTVEHMADGKRLFHHHLNKHVIKKTAHSRARLDKEKEMKEHNEQKQTASVSDDEKSDRDRNAEL